MRRSWTASVSAALLCLAALGAGADWKKDYIRGKERVEEKQYSEAVPLLQKALKEKSGSCQRCFKEGMFFYDYFPLYYLGQAYLALGRTEEAADCFARLENEGVIQKSKDLYGLFQMAQASARSAARPAAPAQPAPPEPVPVKPDPEPPPARVEPATPPPAVTPPPVPAEPSADPSAVQAVRRKLDAANNQLATLDPAELRDHPRLQKHYHALKEAIQEIRGRLGPAAGPRQVAEAEERAVRIQAQVPRLLRTAELLRELRGELDALGGADLRQHADLGGELAGLRERVRALSQRSSDPRNDRDADAQIAELQGILRDSRDLNDRIARRLKAPSAPPSQPAPPAPAITPPAAAPQPEPDSTQRPPAVPMIREGFTAFFKGDLDAAGARARELASGGSAHPYAHLLRGVVAWTLFAAGGGVDDALGKDAREAFAAAKRSGLKAADLPRDLFSPKLIAYFEQAR